MSKSIENVVSYSTAYIDAVSPFGEYCSAQRSWVEEPLEKHREFLGLVSEAFGSTSFMNVVPQLNIWLYHDSLLRTERLIVLKAPSIIIDNQEVMTESYLKGTNDAHIVVLMLIISVNMVKEFS
jgi:hypothetical protein